jgi:hypothetical protein
VCQTTVQNEKLSKADYFKRIVARGGVRSIEFPATRLCPAQWPVRHARKVDVALVSRDTSSSSVMGTNGAVLQAGAELVEQPLQVMRAVDENVVEAFASKVAIGLVSWTIRSFRVRSRSGSGSSGEPVVVMSRRRR